MDKAYWLGRKRASLDAAQNAVSAEARLIHYDLADRYGLKVLSIDAQAINRADSVPPPVDAGVRKGWAEGWPDA